LKIQYVIGDVLEPVGSANEKLIIHCVNNEYAFGSGIAGAIAKKWPYVREEYQNRPYWGLGDIQYVDVGNDIWVVNVCAQRGVGEWLGTKPVRYESLRDGLLMIREDLKDIDNVDPNYTTSLHLGRICSDRSGGKWSIVELIIEEVFGSTVYEIFVYDLPGPTTFNK
jgi:hypothetical protein